MTGNTRPLVLAADRAGVISAAAYLRAGEPVAVPTETVYGLAARADQPEAVAAIYRAKGRPDFNPLIVHVADLAAAERLALLDDRARMLAAAFWPGPLTLVVLQRDGSGIAAAVTAGLPTIALRCPVHPVIRALLDETGLPLAAPSANRSGAISPTSAQHVVESLGDRIGLVLDGGSCAAGIESTIVALRTASWAILRPGPLTATQIEAVLGEPALDAEGGDRVESPGQLASHYAPGKPMRLGASNAAPDEFLIGFGLLAGQANLSVGGNLAEAAANLYACLHAAAAAPEPRIAVAPVPESGIGAAVNDRLRRAAVP